MSESTNCFQLGKQLDPAQVDQNNTWQSTLETLESELQEAGVAGAQCRAAACFLYSAYLHRLPLLLAGASGQDIADALSTSLLGCTAAWIDASMPFDKGTLCEAENSTAGVIVVQNVLAGNWLIPMVQHLPKSQKYFVFLHPFAEDLPIEPRSLFNYMHPILTDAIIDKSPSSSYVGGVMLQNFQVYTSPKKASRPTTLSKLHLVGFAATRLQAVLDDAGEMLQVDNSDLAFLYGYHPYAYATGQSEKFMEITASDQRISKNLQQYFSDLLGQG